jgi:hypothetical protein
MVDGFYSEVYQPNVGPPSCVFISSGKDLLQRHHNASDCDNANAILDSVSTHYYEIIDIATLGESSPPLLSQTNDSLSAYEQPYLSFSAKSCSPTVSLEPSFRPLGQFLSDRMPTMELLLLLHRLPRRQIPILFSLIARNFQTLASDQVVAVFPEGTMCSVKHCASHAWSGLGCG